MLQILGRKRTDATQMVSLDDFQLREVDAGDDACAAVADRRNVTPYCLDHNNRRMIFRGDSAGDRPERRAVLLPGPVRNCDALDRDTV